MVPGELGPAIGRIHDDAIHGGGGPRAQGGQAVTELQDEGIHVRGKNRAALALKDARNTQPTWVRA